MRWWLLLQSRSPAARLPCAACPHARFLLTSHHLNPTHPLPSPAPQVLAAGAGGQGCGGAG